MIDLKTNAVTLTLNLTSGAVTYYTKTGTALLKEKPNSASFSFFNDAGNSSFTVKQSFQLDKDEAIYGLGQQQKGKMSQRNVTLNMVQGNTDDYIPIFQSEKGLRSFLG